MMPFGCTMVPLDVIEIIMEILAGNNDVASLKTCSLACRAFSGVCQKHIFSSIELNSTKRPSKQPARRFKRLLDKNPSIAGYVRSLDYVSHFDSQRGPPILQRLHRVNNFTFGFNDYETFMEGKQDWEKIRPSLKSSLATFIQSNSIVELSLLNIKNLPVTILMYFPHLLRLGLQNVSVADIPLPKGFYKPKKAPNLVSIWIRNSSLGPIRKYLQPGVTPILDLTRLEDLSVVLEDGRTGIDVIKHILMPSENLKSLSFSGAYPDLDFMGNFASVLTSGSLKTLKTVKVFPMLETEETDPYIHFTQELEQIAGKNVLETLLFEIDIETDRRCTTESSRWAQLDLVLSQPNAFPFLRRVELKISIWRWSRPTDEFQARLEEIGGNDFMGIRANKAFGFKFEVIIEDV